MSKTQAGQSRKTRIQSQNEALILDAALEVFSAYGFRGATVDQIAARCGLSKPNLLYYFRRKDDIYEAVLERTLDLWLAPLHDLDPGADAIESLTRYIEAKIDLAFARPDASRLFANEILHGAGHVMPVLQGALRNLVNAKAKVIQQWINDGHLAPIDPHHLIFAIWATTQHYADFSVQVEAVLGTKPTPEQVKRNIVALLVHGLRPQERR